MSQVRVRGMSMRDQDSGPRPAVERPGWWQATWSQVRLSQQVLWQDVAFAIVGALMPIAMGLAPALSMRAEPSGIHGVSMATYLLPGGIAAALIWIFYTTINSAARRRETRVYKRLRATPLADSSILGGEVASAALPALLQAGIVLAVGVAALGVDPPRHALELLPILVLTSATYGLLSMGVSGLLPSGELATWIVTPFLFGMWYVSGALTPLSTLPSWVARLSHFLPATAAADAIRDAYLGYSETSAGRAPLHPGLWAETRPILVLLVWAGVGALLWSGFFRWDPRPVR